MNTPAKRTTINKIKESKRLTTALTLSRQTTARNRLMAELTLMNGRNKLY
jgi:hypothetical protein